ncbi:hypothetical protein BGZ96_002245 [Linnemannia gamsii]|uniref:Peptidase M10 metallopeptidase domain-containing protein n=1 Tax=Linnemannia gamsii TaxID=64522 RepID=A0ABQ7JKX2_9FUNG|nr:hypothetical protein BGZ96_002245 [Linnemannia gamsii]
MQLARLERVADADYTLCPESSGWHRAVSLHPTVTNVHIFRGHLCVTGSSGHTTPRKPSPLTLWLDASAGYIPLWVKNTILHYRFQERTLRRFKDPESSKADTLELFGEALEKWGDAARVRFKYDVDVWDFEIVVRNSDDCDGNACVLASAFFPDPGRHELVIYPKMFTQSREEQVETLIHEIGHVVGLRHWFANSHVRNWLSVLFAHNSEITIINYDTMGDLTPTDKSDLAELYRRVWSGELTKINGTPIILFKPYSSNQPSFQRDDGLLVNLYISAPLCHQKKPVSF